MGTIDCFGQNSMILKQPMDIQLACWLQFFSSISSKQAVLSLARTKSRHYLASNRPLLLPSADEEDDDYLHEIEWHQNQPILMVSRGEDANAAVHVEYSLRACPIKHIGTRTGALTDYTSSRNLCLLMSR